jgi:hypothetical protein
MLNSCRASAQRVSLALFGALAVKYVNGLASAKIVIGAPKIHVLNLFNDHTIAYASFSIAAHASCAPDNLALAKAIGFSFMLSSHCIK